MQELGHHGELGKPAPLGTWHDSVVGAQKSPEVSGLSSSKQVLACGREERRRGHGPREGPERLPAAGISPLAFVSESSSHLYCPLARPEMGVTRWPRLLPAGCGPAPSREGATSPYPHPSACSRPGASSSSGTPTPASPPRPDPGQIGETWVSLPGGAQERKKEREGPPGQPLSGGEGCGTKMGGRGLPTGSHCCPWLSFLFPVLQLFLTSLLQSLPSETFPRVSKGPE